MPTRLQLVKEVLTSVLSSLGVPLVGFIPDPTHYFDMHHSALDQLEAVKNEELTASAAAMAAMVYLAAEQGL